MPAVPSSWLAVARPAWDEPCICALIKTAICLLLAAGKTIEVLGLILANPAPPLPPGVHKDANGLIKSRATLVVGCREKRHRAARARGVP